MEQYSRRNCLLIHGIAEKSDENTDKIICDLAEEKLGVTISLDHIDRSHRVGARGRKDRKGRPLTRPIIVKFIGYRPRSLMYAARAKLKTTRIYIHENLTPERQSLLRYVKERYPGPGNKVWTQDGKVKIRTENNSMIVINLHSDWREHIR